MLAKLLRERFMADLNAFFLARVPGLKPTAGYAGDAPRFLEAVRPALTSVAYPVEAMAQTAIDGIVRGRPRLPQACLFAGRLVARGTVAPPA